MQPNKFTNLFIAVIFGFSTTLNASILPNSQILQSNLNSVSIENPHCISKSNYGKENSNSQIQNNSNANTNSSNINLQAGGDITQASVKDTNYYYHRVTKSSLFGLNQSLHEKEAYNEKALISQALANDGSLTYNAKNNLLLSGVKTYSNKDTNLNADNVFITSLELNSFENEVNKKSKFNLGGFLFETGLKIPLAFSGVILPTDSTEIYKSELHKSNTIKTTNQASNLSSNANLNINSNQDITIKGSNLNANNNINLSSQSANINIISSQDITQTKTLDEVKRVEIGGANDFIKTLIDDIKDTSIQGHGTIAKIEKSNTDTTKTTITNNSSNLNAKNININSNLDTNIKASNLNANENININSQSGNINILSDKNLNQSQSNSNLKERIHFVDYKSDNTNLDQTNISSNIISDNINLNANEITLKASNIIANESIQIDTTRLNLISDKDNHTSISNENNKDTLIAEVKSNGKIQEIEIPAIIQTGDKFILNGKDISDKLDKQVYETISNSLNDETIKNSIIKQISSNSKTPLNQEEINQIQVALNNDEWDKSTKSLSQVGAIVVTIVVSIFTAGTAAPAASSALVGTTSAAATTTTAAVTAAAIESATSAVISNLAVQSANMALSKGQIKFDLNSLINSTATATLGSLGTSFVNQGIANFDSATNINSLNNYANANGSINPNLLNEAINKHAYYSIAQKGLGSVANSALQKGIYNTDFKDSLIANLTNSLTDILYKKVGDIGYTQGETYNNDYFKDGGLGKVALHATAGGIASKLMGDKFATGAISAGLNEAISPLTANSSDQAELATSQLIGTIVGGWLNGDKGANTGFTINTSATLNNRQLHQKEIDLAKQKAAEYANLKGISQEEALKRLLIAGASMTDMLWANSFDTNSDDIAGAIEYLSQFKNQTYIDKDGKAQNYFVASGRDYYKPYINLYEPAFSEVPNLSDYLQSGITQSPYQGIIGKIENAGNYALNNKSEVLENAKNGISNSVQSCIDNPVNCGSNILQGIGNGFIDGTYGLAYNILMPDQANNLNDFYGFNASDYLVALSVANLANSGLTATGIAGVGKVTKDGVVAVGKASVSGASKFATQIETNALTKITENLPKGYKFDTATGTAISPNGTRYAMNGVTDISGSPVWQQIGKQGSLTEQYFVFANNAKQQISKPQILKNQPQSMVWDSAYNGVNFVLKKPNAIPDFVESYLPGIPNYSGYGYFGGAVGAGYGYDKLNQNIKDFKNWLKSDD